MAKLKMKMLPAGFPVALCSTAIQFCDRHSNRSVLLLRIADFVVDAVDDVDVSVSEIVAFPPGEHLAFSGIILMHRQSLDAVEEVSGEHQHSNEEPNVWRSVTVPLVEKVMSFKSDAIVKDDFFFANIVLRQLPSVSFVLPS